MKKLFPVAALLVACTSAAPPPVAPDQPPAREDRPGPSCRPLPEPPFAGQFTYDVPTGWEQIGRLYSSIESVFIFAHRDPQDSQAQVNVLLAPDPAAECARERAWLEGEGATADEVEVLPDGCRFAWRKRDRDRAGVVLVRRLGSTATPELAVKTAITGLFRGAGDFSSYADTVNEAFGPVS